MTMMAVIKSKKKLVVDNVVLRQETAVGQGSQVLMQLPGLAVVEK